MSTGGIKELVADVDVVAGDIRASAVNTAAIRDQNVTTAKIASASVTLTKLAGEVGVWRGFHFTTVGGGALTTANRTIYTAAVTLLGAICDITTAVSAATSVTIENTAGTGLVVFAKGSAIATLTTQNLTAVGTVKAITIAAGGSIRTLLSTGSNELVGNLYFLTIETPT